MNKRNVLRLLVPVVAPAALIAATAETTTYFNPRFGVSADVPTGWTALPPPYNNDGRTFVGHFPDTYVTVFGNYAVIDPAEEIAMRRSPHQGETVTYEFVDEGVIVVSGTIPTGHIFYRRSELACDGRVWGHVNMHYPAEFKDEFDPIVTHIAKSLKIECE